MTSPHPGLGGHWEVSTIEVAGELVPPIEGSRLTLAVSREGISSTSQGLITVTLTPSPSPV